MLILIRFVWQTPVRPSSVFEGRSGTFIGNVIFSGRKTTVDGRRNGLSSAAIRFSHHRSDSIFADAFTTSYNFTPADEAGTSFV